MLTAGSVTGEKLTRYGAGYQHEQQRAAPSGGFLTDDGQFGHSGTATAELLGEVDADESVLSQFQPEFVGWFVSRGPLGKVGGAVFVGDRGYGGTQVAMLARFGEVHSPELS